MAENLQFPILFDLEKGVETAIKDWDSKYADKLEKAIQKRALGVKLKFDTKAFDNLDDVKRRLAELKITPLTPENKQAIQELTKELKGLAKLMEKISNFKGIELPELQAAKAAKLRKDVAQADEKLRLSKERVRQAEERLILSQQRAAQQANRTSKAYGEQGTYLERLMKKIALYASFRMAGNFLTSVRAVTAQFELQRVSLGAILQDANKGEQIFSQIKQFALNSPLSILDMTGYTKQLAAYKIEYDELFEMTKRLADISVGLGVDYQRIVLAAGQTRTATYLRASELKQFTELGVPLLEELSIKLSTMNGEMVSTAEVMDMISKRAISWELVKEVLYDMTDAGGMFYNMQEKQSQTLYGMWAKLGDAAAVMYDEIGNTATVNSGMKFLIQLLQDAMLHWTAFANVLQTVVLGFAAYKAAMAGLVPFYKLNRIQIMASIKAKKAQQSLLLRRTSLYTKLTIAQLRQLASTKKLTTAEWKEYITKNKLNQISALRLARMSKENAALQKALIKQKLYTKEQLQQIQAMSKGQYVWATVKSAVMGVGNAIKAVGASLKTFWPLAAITAVIDLLMGWRQAVEAQEAAVKKVDKQYEEMKVTLMEIENAYNDIKNVSKSATENEEEFAKTSYSQKLEQLNNIMKLLSQFGLKNTIDLSVLNYENIDPVIDNWIKKLNEANELSQKWGRSVAEVANAYEGTWSIFGENLNEDMKDLSRSWTKLTANTEFNNSLRQLKAIVGELANENKGVYDQISKAVGMDLKLALAQKRRNESEVQYQQRIYKNYQNIVSSLQTSREKGEYGGMLPNLSAADVADRFRDFKSDLAEVMHEVRKTIAAFEDEEPMTIRMAIDQQFTLNEWEEWQKELVIQELNKDRLKAGLDLIPTLSSAATGAVAEGLKAIITSEFPGLFNDEELQSLVSAEGIVEAIKTKLDASNERLEKSVQLQNNLAYGSKGFENSLDRVKKLQQEITDIENMRAELEALEAIEGGKTEEQLLRQSELQAKLAEVDEASINTKRAQIAAIVEANAKYDEQIQKQRESAETEREIAKAALERVSSMGLSDLSKDVKEQFGGLMVDPDKEMPDKNYSTDFLISDEDLKKVRDVGDLYAQWAQNTKAIKDEKEKLVGVGITEATIEKERAALEEKRAKIQPQLSAVEKEITDEKFKGREAQYATLKLALANATTADAQKTAKENLNKFLGDTKNAEFAILMLKREGLKTSLKEALVSEAANNQIDAYLKGLDNADKLWEELGKRYNFRLQETGGDHGGSGEDPWIILMKNRMKFMQDFQKGVEDLSKWMGYTKGLADEQENMLGRGLSLKIDSRKLNGTKDELIAWYEDAIGEVRKRIAKLGGKEWEGLGVQMILAKDTKSRVIKKYQELLQDLFKEMTDFRTEQMQSEMERKLKQLADRISRTKTAKEFYEKILSQTGDEKLALRVTTHIYGESGQDLKEQVVSQIETALSETKVDLPAGIIDVDKNIDYKALREFANKAKETRAIGDGVADELIKIANNGEKELSRVAQEGAKLLLKYDEIAQQRVNIEQEASSQIKTLREAEALYLASNASEAEKAAYSKRTNKAVAGVEADRDLKLLKLQDEYLRFFSAIHSLTNKEAEALRTKVREALFKAFQSGAISADELKRELKTVDEQFQKLIDDSGFAMDYLKGGFDGLIQRLRDTADEVQSVAAKISKMESPDDISEGQKSFIDKILGKFGDKTTGNNFAELSSKTNDNLKQMGGLLDKVSGKIGGMANGAASALAIVDTIIKGVASTINGIAQIRDQINAMRSEDNQLGGGLWDSFEYLENFNKYAASGWEKLKSGDVAGAVTDTVSSIVSIFGTSQAQKVKRLNKRIKEQQEILEELEYSYGRLEKAADRLFGSDYIQNYNQRMRSLEAQQQAYLKQAQLERDKGKSADKEKIKQYENSARDVADQIAEMQSQIAERMTGTDVASAARDFANAWLEAYATFGNTTGAIKEKFNDMIKNMIVESVMAKVVQNALQPMFDEMNEMYKEGASMTEVLSFAFRESAQLSKDIDNGLTVAARQLEAAGIDIKSLYASSDNITGISRDFATASESSINGLAAMYNTEIHHTSYLPVISANVEIMRQLMEARIPSASTTDYGVNWTDWQNQAMDHYRAIRQYTYETAQRCERAAAACEAISEKLGRAFTTKGSSQGFNVYLKQ
nr:hypothetical protein [Bacteroides acidifaciens]